MLVADLVFPVPPPSSHSKNSPLPSHHGRYEHYLPDERHSTAPEGVNGGKADSFTQMFFSLQHNLEDLVEKAEEVKTETNRAAVATANAEIRRGGGLYESNAVETHSV